MVKADKLISKYSFAQDIENYSARESKINELASKLHSIVDLKPTVDYNYKAGKFIGLVKLMSRSFKKRTELAEAFGISERIFTLFNDSFGTPSYMDKNGVLVDAIPMNIARVVEILQYLEELWEIPSIEDEYSDFNKKHVDKVYANALVYAKDQMLVQASLLAYEE